MRKFFLPAIASVVLFLLLLLWRHASEQRTPAETPSHSKQATAKISLAPNTADENQNNNPGNDVAKNDEENAEAPEPLRRALPGILALLPNELRSRASLRLTPLREDSPIWIAQLYIDNARVEQSDIQMGVEQGKARNYSPPFFPYAKKEIPPFPEKDSTAGLEQISELLKGEGSELTALDVSENTWWPNRAQGLTPCQNFHVEYTDAQRVVRNETWCLNPNSGRIEQRRSTVRN